MSVFVITNFLGILSGHMLSDDRLSTMVIGMNSFMQVIVRYKVLSYFIPLEGRSILSKVMVERGLSLVKKPTDSFKVVHTLTFIHVRAFKSVSQ